MNAKKTVLAVLVISLFVFYIVCTLIIQSQKQELKAIESRLSSYRQHSYHQTEATARTTQKSSASPTPRPAAQHGSARREIDTSPSTDGFYDPEDFYEWYIDDFIDFEDAEEYYYEHGGK